MASWVKYLLPYAGCVFVAAVSNATDKTPVPTLEFLEFLAEFETEDGVWLDPFLPEPATIGSEGVGEPASDNEEKQ